MTFDPGTLAVVLAAGAGRRFHGREHKLAAPLADGSVLHRVLTHVGRAGFDQVVVITGARRLAELDGDAPAEVVEVHHPGWDAGQATSVQTAIAVARQRGANAVVIGLGDQPGIPTEAWRAVAASTSPIAVATYDGRRANPVRLAAEVWPLLPTDGDEGARIVMRVHPELVEEVPCHGNPGDIDTVEDLDSWN